MFTENGLIARNGQWISCNHTEHVKTMIANPNGAPFVVCHTGDTVEFEAYYYTAEKVKPTQAQFETLMDWCTAMREKFEDVTDCWNEPWQSWREMEIVS